MHTHKQVIDEAYDELHAAYSKAFGDWWLNSSARTSSWGFDIVEYEGEELIRSTDGYVELRVEQVKVIGRNSWMFFVFQVFPEDVGKEYEFAYGHNISRVAEKFMELQLQMKLADK
jgi:hypothetical protein